MKKDIQENLIIDYLNGELNSRQLKEVEEYIVSNEDAQRVVYEYQAIYETIDNCQTEIPSSKMGIKFSEFLDQEISNQNTTESSRVSKLLRQLLLLGALLLIGLIVGLNLGDDTPSQNENYLMASNDNDMLDLLNESSVSNRIRAVNMSTYTQLPEDAIIRALSKTLLTDKSDHVRLVSVDALAKFTEEKGVRNTLIRALEKEKDETIQIALINLLASIKEKDAMESFDKIIQNRNAVDFVKNEAHSGKLKLIETY